MPDALHQLLETLQARTGETAVLAVASGANAVFVDSVESRQAVRYAARPGKMVPLHVTATGRALLSQMTPADRAKVLTGVIYVKRGILTIDSNMPVADQSPFTILVVDRLDLYDGPNLVLNSNYQNSPVPVPPGLGPTGNQKVHLEK